MSKKEYVIMTKYKSWIEISKTIEYPSIYLSTTGCFQLFISPEIIFYISKEFDIIEESFTYLGWDLKKLEDHEYDKFGFLPGFPERFAKNSKHIGL